MHRALLHWVLFADGLIAMHRKAIFRFAFGQFSPLSWTSVRVGN